MESRTWRGSARSAATEGIIRHNACLVGFFRAKLSWKELIYVVIAGPGGFSCIGHGAAHGRAAVHPAGIEAGEQRGARNWGPTPSGLRGFGRPFGGRQHRQMATQPSLAGTLTTILAGPFRQVTRVPHGSSPGPAARGPSKATNWWVAAPWEAQSRDPLWRFPAMAIRPS